MKSMWLARTGLCLTLLGAASMASVGCGDDSDSDKNSDNGGGDGDGDSQQNGVPSYVGQTAKAHITAAEGGTLTAGAVRVSIPAGAVSEDVEITLEIKGKNGLPDEADIAIDVYEFGPSMQFEQPVELAFDLTSVTTPDDKRPTLAYYDEAAGKWSPLTSEENKSVQTLTGTTTHFSKFSVIFVATESGNGMQVGGQCGAEFEACGGNPVGTWTYTAACLTLPDGALPSLGANFGSCKDQPFMKTDFDLTGTVSFAEDNTFTVDQTSSVTTGLYVPLSCLEQIGATNGLNCDAFGGEEMGEYCVQADDPEAPDVDMDVGTYVVEGSQLVMTKEGDDDPDVVDFCVTGDTLTVRVTDPRGTVAHYTATRQ